MFELKPYTNKNNSVFFDPFRDMEALERRFFGRPLDFFGGERLPAFKTDIREDGERYLLDADLPGCEKSDIRLELNGDLLTIRAERKSEQEEKDEKNHYLRRERSYGSFRRDFDVSAIDTEKIEAKYDNGVLHVTLPKKTETLPASKTLEIQ